MSETKRKGRHQPRGGHFPVFVVAVFGLFFGAGLCALGFLLVRGLLGSGRERAAARKAVETAPESLEARLRLGQMLEARGERDAAESEYSKAAELAGGDPRPYYHLGRISAARGHHEVAAAYYRKALAKDPGHAPSAHYLASLLAGSGKYEEAISLLSAALARDPENASLRCNLAHAFLKKGDAERAASEFRRALPRSPEKAEACYFLGRALEMLGKLEEAREAYRNALDLDRGLAMAWYALAQLEERSGDSAAAAAALEGFRKTRAARDAAAALREKLEKSPDDLELLRNYAHAMVDRDRPEEALEALQRAETLAPGDSRVSQLRSLAEAALAEKRARLERLRRSAPELFPQESPESR